MVNVNLEIEELKGIDPVLDGKESCLVKAAVQEYLDMLSGEKVFSKASDIKEYRLLLLIENVFEEMPSEMVVANLFQLKRSEARTLIKNVDAKYRRRLNNKLEQNLKKLVNSIDEVKNDKDETTFYCESQYQIDKLNERLLSYKPAGTENSQNLSMIWRDKQVIKLYHISRNSLKVLREIWK